MKTKQVLIPATVDPIQIDDFPEGCERSCKGALHLRPSSTKMLTAGELGHLEKKYKGVFARLQFIESTESVPKAAKPPDTGGDGGSGGSEGSGDSEGSGTEGSGGSEGSDGFESGDSAETVTPPGPGTAGGQKTKRGRSSR